MMNTYSLTQVQSRFPLHLPEKRAGQTATQPTLLKFPHILPTPAAGQHACGIEQTQRRASITPISRHSAATQGTVVMQLTIDTSCLIQLRQLVMGTSEDMVMFMRAHPIARATKMKVWLCVRKPFVAPIMDTVMRVLPSTKFGPFRT